MNPKRNVDRAMEQFRQRADEIGQRVNQEVGQRVSQIDPVVIGTAAAAVLVGVTVLFLVRRRKH
jgi:tetrahydromethanopterin S-methyltransferase subunit F